MNLLSPLLLSTLPTQPIPETDFSSFLPLTHYYRTHENGNEFETPVLVRNSLPEKTREEICNAVAMKLGDVPVDLQRQTRGIGTSVAKCELSRALEFLMRSGHNDAFFCFCEGLLEGRDGLEEAKRALHSVKEGLFGGGDMLEYFPDGVRPSDCLVLAGEGATSTLHRDPYTWTGTSLCLEGAKIWRFVAPPGVAASSYASESGVSLIDGALRSYRLPSHAWEDGIPLSSGWQSDCALFAERKAHAPSAREFAVMAEERKMRELENLAQNLDALKISADFPRFFDETPIRIWTAVQKPGDMLVIPAFWWHQTYAPEPSLAVASQRAGLERDAGRVLRHVFDTVGYTNYHRLPDLLTKDRYDPNDSPKDIVQQLFQVLSQIM